MVLQGKKEKCIEREMKGILEISPDLPACEPSFKKCKTNLKLQLQKELTSC